MWRQAGQHNPYDSAAAPQNAAWPPPQAAFSRWKLVLDDDTCSTVATTQQHRSQAPQQSSVNGQDFAAAQNALPLPQRGGQVEPPTQPPFSDFQPLTPWEATAIQLARAVRSYRTTTGKNAGCLSDTSKQRRKHKDDDNQARWRESDASESSLARIASALMLPPQNDSSGSRSTSPLALSSCPTQPPILLEYFLRVGYPLHPSPSRTGPLASAEATEQMCDNSAYIAVLAASAAYVVRWFFCVEVPHTEKGTEAVAAPRRERTLPLLLLPDVVKQLVTSHTMAPRTAAVWLVRVYVDLLTAESNRVRQELGVRCGAPLDSPPAWPLPLYCAEAIRRYAEAMGDAVYHVQGNALPVVRLDERLAYPQQPQHYLEFAAQARADNIQEDTFALSACAGEAQTPQGEIETSSKKEEWRYLYLMVLQHVVTLLLRGCTSCSADAEEEGTAAPPTQTPSESAAPDARLRPAVSACPVVLEGLMKLAFFLRIKFDYLSPTRRYCRIDLKGKKSFFTPSDGQDATLSSQSWAELTSEVRVLHPVEKQWLALTPYVVRCLPKLGPSHHHFVPLLDFVLSLR